VGAPPVVLNPSPEAPTGPRRCAGQHGPSTPTAPCRKEDRNRVRARRFRLEARLGGSCSSPAPAMRGARCAARFRSARGAKLNVQTPKRARCSYVCSGAACAKATPPARLRARATFRAHASRHALPTLCCAHSLCRGASRPHLTPQQAHTPSADLEQAAASHARHQWEPASHSLHAGSQSQRSTRSASCTRSPLRPLPSAVLPTASSEARRPRRRSTPARCSCSTAA